MPAHSIKNNTNRAILAVTNDLVSDNRVNKVAISLLKLGFEVVLVGRLLPDSLPLSERSYAMKRFRLPFRKGPLFYGTYNLRLLIYLLFHRSRVIVSNDLDTLPACYIASKMRGVHLVYDSHEYFTEVPELVNRPNIQQIWEKIERSIVPKLKHCITVSASIAEIYTKKYGVPFHLVRNVPTRKDVVRKATTESLPFPVDLPIILYQGAVNLGRGIEEAILAMHQISNARLIVIGDGDLWNACNNLVQREKLSKKVILTGKLSFDRLNTITPIATMGLSIEKDMGLNYRYALPNKLFDYINAGVPIISSSLPEIKNVMQTFETGICIEEVTPVEIARAAQTLLENPDLIERFRINCIKASKELCWEHEEEVLRTIYAPLMKKK